MTKIKFRQSIFVLISLLLVLLLGLSACGINRGEAAEPVAGVLSQETAEEKLVEGESGGDFAVSSLDRGLILAATLINLNVDNATGQDLGEIQDVLIDTERGNVLFARVGHNGCLDIADEAIIVPLAAMEWDRAEEAFVLAVDDDAFALWPPLGGNWPDPSDPTWHAEVIAFWKNAGVDLFWDASTSPDTVAWASSQLDSDAGSDRGAEEGNVTELSFLNVKEDDPGFYQRFS